MAAPVVKTLCDRLPQYPPPYLFATPTHNYYEEIGYTTATHQYIESEAAKSCTEITKEDGSDIAVKNGGVITASL